MPLRICLGFVAALVFGVLPAMGQEPNFELPAPVAIRNITVIPAPGQRLDNADILIVGQRIAAVGRDLAIPAGTRIVDGTGLVAYAGFIDGFTRVGVSDPKLSEADERRLEGDDYSITEDPLVKMPEANRHGIFARRKVVELLDIQEKTYQDQRSAGFTTALAAPPRGILGGSASVIELGAGPLRNSVVAADVAQTASFEPPPQRAIKVRGNYPGTLLGVIAQYRQTMLDADQFSRARSGSRDALNGIEDLDLVAFAGASARGRGTLAWEVNGTDAIRRAMALSFEFGYSPLIVGGRDAWRIADELRRADVAVVVSLKVPPKPQEYKLDPNEIRKAADDPSLYGRNWVKRPFEPRAAYEAANKRRDEEIGNLAKLEAAGVPWTVSTYELKKPDEAWTTLREAMKAGLAADAVLRALTTTPAKTLGIDGDQGTIAPGKRANLTILTKDLGAEDAAVRYVFVDGRQFEFDVNTKKGKKDDKDAAPNSDAPASQATTSSATANSVATSPTTQTQPTPPGPLDDILLHEPKWVIETEAARDPGLRTGGSALLRNAYVIPIIGEDEPGTSILIEKGKIAKIGKDLVAPPGVMELDLAGYVVMPGIIDPHSHIALDGINEWTGSVTPEVRCADVINSEDANIFRALAGGCTTAHLMHGSANTIGGQCVLVKLKYGRPPAEMLLPEGQRTVKFALGENVKRPGMTFGSESGDPCAAGRPKRFPGTRMGVETTLRRALQAGQDYSQARAAAAKAGAGGQPMRRDLRLEALADIVDGKIWINTHCYRADEVLRLLETCEAFGVRVAALHHVLEAYRTMPEILRHGSGTATFADWWAYKEEAYDAVPQNAGMLLRFGINSTIKSDSADLMRHMNHEAAKCMKYGGLTANETLRLITINPARMFGLEPRLGSIEVGKDADLAVFSGHPLDSFSRCVMTVVDGEVYFRDATFDPRATPVAGRPVAQPKPLPPAAAAPRGDAPAYAITGATLHPISGPMIPEGTLVMRDGRITAAGAGVAVPPDAEVIRADGLHVYPGLINAATTVGLYERGMTEVTVDTNEIGTFQTDVTAISAFNPHSAMVEVTRADGVTTLVLMPAGGLISGQAGLLDLNGWTMNEMLRDPKFGLVVNLPSPRTKPIIDEEPKRHPEFDDEEPEPEPEDQITRSLKKLERFFRDARVYAEAARWRAQNPGATPKLALPPFDPRFEAMIPYVMGEKPVFFNAGSYKHILEVVMFADQLGLKPIIVGGNEAWKCADLLAKRQIPVIYEGTFEMPGGIATVPRVSEAWDANYRALQTMAAAGVKFCLMHRSADLAKLVPLEAGFAVAYGLDPDIALRALTLGAAEILGIQRETGSLDVGKWGDLIVTTDSPLQATSQVRYEFIRGRPVDLKSLHTRNAEKFANRPKTSLPPARNDLKGPPSQSGAPSGQ